MRLVGTGIVVRKVTDFSTEEVVTWPPSLILPDGDLIEVEILQVGPATSYRTGQIVVVPTFLYGSSARLAAGGVLMHANDVVGIVD